MKKHLSTTQLMMLARCPKQYEFRYILGIRQPPGVALVIGKSTHAANELDLRSKMAWGTLLDEAEVQAAAAAHVRTEWASEPPELADGDPDQGEAIDQAVALATTYHREIAPGVQPTALEREFRLEIEGCNFDLVGFKDVEEGGDRIRDTKTAAKAPVGNEAERSPQLSLYWLESHLRGEDPKVTLDYLIKGKKPRAVTLTATRTPADGQRMLAWIEAASRQIEAGAFPPTDPSNWACSSRWCGYWERCPHGARQSTVVPVTNLVARIRAPEAA